MCVWLGCGGVRQVLRRTTLRRYHLNFFLVFIRPPLPAVLLAMPAWFGKIPLYVCLSLLNAVAWWMTAQLSHAMTGSDRVPSPWLVFFSGFVTIAFVFDMFDLGQPNLVLLALMLYGFWLLQHERPLMARHTLSFVPSP